MDIERDDLTIRPATAADAPAIAHIHVASWREAYAGIVPTAYLEGLDVDAREQWWVELLDHSPLDRPTSYDDAHRLVPHRPGPQGPALAADPGRARGNLLGAVRAPASAGNLGSASRIGYSIEVARTHQGMREPRHHPPADLSRPRRGFTAAPHPQTIEVAAQRRA